MEFKVEYVPGEERDGFYIQPLMKRMWMVQLDILNVIHRICRHHNLKYFGWYGTLLGAVRHHGFIPWDDDMDLAMLRGDYEKFLYFSKTELPPGWKVIRVGPTLIRVINTEVINLSQDFLDRFHGCPYVMGIDIFALDDIPPDENEKELWITMYGAVATLHLHWDSFAEDDRQEQLREIEELTGYHFHEQTSIEEQLHTLADNIAAMYWDADYDEVTTASTLYRRRSYRIPKAWFGEIIEVPFEDTVIAIPKNYDLPCKLIYGDDYMTPQKWSVHNGFKTQIDLLQEHFNEKGETLPECFTMEFEE